jgi:hypothetical protein
LGALQSIDLAKATDSKSTGGIVGGDYNVMIAISNKLRTDASGY